MSTSATEVSIHAVSPPLGVQLVSTAGTAATAAYLSVSATAATAPAHAGTAGGGGFADAAAGAAGAAGAAAAGAAGAAAAGASVVAGAVAWAKAAAGAQPMNTAVASAGARRESLRLNIIVGDSNLEWEATRRRLERVHVLLARTDPHRRVEAVNEDFAVTDLAGARGGNDRLNYLVGNVCVHRDFDFQLGEETHGIFRPAINFRMPLLSTVALDLCNRQTVHSDGGERIAHLLQLERLYDRHYDFHKPRPIVTRRGAVLEPNRSRAVRSERKRAPPDETLQGACHDLPSGLTI